jgi:site-specific DNA-methyltransferase (adenine-specific)
LEDEPLVLNRALFRLRKAGRLQSVPTEHRTDFRWEEADDYLFASEIAWRHLRDRNQASLDEILCNPWLADEFDGIARKFAPGYSSLQYRWAALKLRKVSNVAAHRSARIPRISLPASWLSHDASVLSSLRGEPGLYLVYGQKNEPLYAGETFDLEKRLKKHFVNGTAVHGWKELGSDLRVTAVSYSSLRNTGVDAGNAALGTWLVACQYRLITQESPKLNSLVLDLAAV